MPQASGIVVNGWAIFAHPLFLDEVLELTEKVERHKAKDPGTYKKKNARTFHRTPPIRNTGKGTHSATDGSSGSGRSSFSSTGYSSASTRKPK